MNKAYISKDDRRILVGINDYLVKYEIQNIQPYCPTCDNILYVRAKSSPNTRVHFYHKGVPCPTIEKSRERFLRYEFKYYRHEQKQRVLTEVSSNLSKIYNHCLELCDKALFPSEFKDLLILGSQKRVWEYTGIQLYHIPFVLLTLQLEFSKRKNLRRKRGIFFLFKEANYNENQLWIEFTKNICFQMYDAKSTDLIKEININEDFLLCDFWSFEKFTNWRQLYKFNQFLY